MPLRYCFCRNSWAACGGDLTDYSGVKTFYQRVISCICVTRVLSVPHPMSESIHSNGRNDLDQRLWLILSVLGYQSKNGANFSEAKCVLKMSFFKVKKKSFLQTCPQTLMPYTHKIFRMASNTLSTDLEICSKHIKLVDMKEQQKTPQTPKLSVTI